MAAGLQVVRQSRARDLHRRTCVHIADRLAAQGLLSREQADADRRQVLLTLTPRGASVLERLARLHRDELRRLAPEITAALTRLSTSLE